MLVFTLVACGLILITFATLINFVGQYAKSSRQSVAEAEALALAEGAIDMAAYHLNTDQSYSGESGTALGAGTYSISVATIDSVTKKVTVWGYVPNAVNPVATKKLRITMRIDTSIVSFRFAIQSGNGGFDLQNSSTITGNVYSAGPVTGTGGVSTCNGLTSYGNCIYGDVVSAGSNGVVYGVFATSSIFANVVGNASIKTSAANAIYYATSSQNVYDSAKNAIAAGNKHSGSTDKPTAALPISDALIDSWEVDAAAGGTMATSSCDSYASNTNTCTISSDKTLGPLKLPFNILVKSSGKTLTVSGPLWVVGNITLQTSPHIQMDEALGGSNVAVIADDPDNRNTSGVINIGQGTVFAGTHTAGSYVFMVARNSSAENNVANNVCSNGSLDAVCMNQSSSALVAYASHGQITFAQSASVKSATAYKIILTQTANAIYDTGLPATMFEAGSGGSWIYIPGTFAILQ